MEREVIQHSSIKDSFLSNFLKLHPLHKGFIPLLLLIFLVGAIAVTTSQIQKKQDFREHASATGVLPSSEPTCFGKTQSEWASLGYKVIIGSDLADKLNGTSGRDVIIGLGGNDTINGSYGDDVICGGDGNDVINGGDGNDQIDGGAGDDIISGGNGNDMLSGGDGNDTLKGENNDDVLSGGPGDDKLDAGSGKNILSGGDGRDILTGSFGDDMLFGGAGDDTIYAKSGNDIIDGGSGNDLIYGDDGNDTLVGGEGDDNINGGSGSDILVGDCFTTGSILSTSQKEWLTASESVLGILYDTSCLTSGADVLNGGSGIDYLIGDSASEAPPGTVLVVPTHDPSFICGTCVENPNDQTVKLGNLVFEMYGDGNDKLDGGNGGGGEVINTPERLYGNGGNDVITDPDGDEYYYGGPGDDRITANWGTDYIYGGTGNDYCDGGGNNPGILVDVAHDCETVVNVEKVFPTAVSVTPTPILTPAVIPSSNPKATPTTSSSLFTVNITEPVSNYQLPQYSAIKISVATSKVASSIKVFFDSLSIKNCYNTALCTFWYTPNASPGTHTISANAQSTSSEIASNSITVRK